MELRDLPANEDRCCMGYPLGDEFRCVNAADGDDLWCVDCRRGIDGGGEGCGCAACVKPFNEETA